MRTRSPFPGMDPWLEAYWGDMHHRIIQYGCDQIEAQLPPGLVAVVETTMYLVDLDWEMHRIKRPDFSVINYGQNMAGPLAEDGGIAIAEPVRITLPYEPHVQGHIEIRTAGGSELITAFEVLSPANKLNPGARSAYLQKQRDYYSARVNVVELDLLRDGEHLIGVPLENIDPAYVTPYKCAVRRAGETPTLEVEYFPLPLRSRLSRIPLPLRVTDPDVICDLQLIVDDAYRKGRYATQIDYTKSSNPALSPDDTAWAAELIAQSSER